MLPGSHREIMPQETLEARPERAQRRLASPAKTSSPPSPNGGVPNGLEERLLAAISASEASLLRVLRSHEAIVHELKEEVANLIAGGAPRAATPSGATPSAGDADNSDSLSAKKGKWNASSSKVSAVLGAPSQMPPQGDPSPTRRRVRRDSKESPRAAEALAQNKEQIWNLVKTDQKVVSLLSDARKEMDAYVSKHDLDGSKHGGDMDGSKDGVRSITQGARSRVQDARSKVQGVRSRVAKKVARLRMSASHTSVARYAATMRDSYLEPWLVTGPLARLRRDGCCIFVFGGVMHPDCSFRSSWNMMMAIGIIYCGIIVPIEIAFENDMVWCWWPMIAL